MIHYGDIKMIIFYHAQCLDGFGAAYVYYQKYPNAAYYPVGYKTDIFSITNLSDQDIIFLDFSVKLDEMKRVCDIAKSVTIIDHHVSAVRELDGLEVDNLTKILDITRSGAALAWMSLTPEEPPEFIRLIEDRDLWKFEYEHTKDFTQGLNSYEMSFEVWNSLNIIDGVGISRVVEIGRIINQKFEKDLNSILKGVFYAEIDGCVVPVVNASLMYASEAGNRMSIGHNFAAIFCVEGGSTKVCLRSDKGTENHTDVSKIAEKFGGGGHRNAAGFQLPTPDWFEWVMKIRRDRKWLSE